ncbi:MAG TPA: NADH-quinone oxidoreductase subunit M [Gemmatimonadales bacterium]
MGEFLAGIGYQRWIVQALLIVPLLAAVAVALAPAARARQVALWGAVAEFVLSIGLWWSFDASLGVMQFEAVAPWIPKYGVSYRVGIDGISLFMVLLTTLTMPLAVLGSWNYIKVKEKGFYALLLVLTTGMIGVFVALDLFLFYVFWEVMLIPMYFIIGMWGGTRRLYAAIKFFLYTFVGSLLMLVAILTIYYAVGRDTGTYSFDYYHLLANIDVVRPHAFWLFGAFALAFAIKVPMFPFHTWLPDAYTEAPTAGSVILAAVMLKLGAYGFIRFAVPLFPAAAQTFAPAIIVLSLIAIIYGAIVALVQPDLKRLVAYSSVSHMGFVTLGIFVFTEQGLQGAVLQMINHGLITGALFLLVGVIYERTHDRTIAKMSGLSARTPVYAAILGFFVFASGGLPGLSGFVGEFLVLVGTFAANPYAAAIATFVMILAAAYLLYMYQRIAFGEVSDFLAGLGNRLTDIGPVEILTLAPLAGLVVIFGIQPGLLLNVFGGTVRETLDSVRPAAAIEIPTAVLIGLIVIAVAGVIGRIGWTLMRPSAESSTGLEPDPRPAR